jgi:uncharacterized protein YndB with AHSA1/START domain
MTTPDVPLRMELIFTVPGTPEQVWDAIATAGGITSWFLPTDLDERVGGTIVTHMGEEASSEGTVEAWDPPRRLAYAEPGWAELAGHADAPVTPLATEFLVEAREGGTCVVRIVSSAFGTGADWEGELFEYMEQTWAPFFDHLRLYLTHFPGQRATTLTVDAALPGHADDVWAAMGDAVGPMAVGAVTEVRGLTGRVERNEGRWLLVRLTDPFPGMLALLAHPLPDGGTLAQVATYLFAPVPRNTVDRERKDWKAWLESLAIHAL